MDIKVYVNKKEELQNYNNFRIEQLTTTIDCEYRTELLLQVKREMDRDFRVHLHVQGPRILKKYLIFKEFRIVKKEENKKQDSTLNTVKEKADDCCVEEEKEREMQRGIKKNEKGLENWNKVERKKEESKLMKRIGEETKYGIKGERERR